MTTKHPLFAIIILAALLLLIVACADSSEAPAADTPLSDEAPTSTAPTAVAVQPSATAPPAIVDSATATPPPTSAPADPTNTPAPTAVPTEAPRTAEPTPAPTSAATAIVQPEWLAYLNQFRLMANLPQLQNDDLLSLGSEFHSQYMVKNNNAIAHNQQEDNPYYDPAGDQAAENGNIFATNQVDANFVWGMNFWISAPFHLVPMLDPRLGSVGFGDFNEAPGSVQMAAVLDVGSAPPAQPDVTYPIFFPADGSSTWVVRHSMFEWPDPLTSCPGFSRPTGAPIVLQLGDGSQQPRVISHTVFNGDRQVETCLITETTYRNPDSYAESVGRTILDLRDAVVIMPRHPLPINETYDVQVVTDGGIYDWSFNTVQKP